MSRQSYQQDQIPTGVEAIPYSDWRALANGVLRHAPSLFMGRVVGADAAGGELAGVPFEPAVILGFKNAATATAFLSTFGSGGAAHHLVAAAAAENPNPPVLTQEADGTWTVALPTEMAPDTHTVILIVLGASAVGGSE